MQIIQDSLAGLAGGALAAGGRLVHLVGYAVQ